MSDKIGDAGRGTNTRSAAVLLLFLGGLALAGVVLGILGATSVGQTRELLAPRSLLVISGSLAVGIGLIALARQLWRNAPWARLASVLVFALMAVLTLAGTASMVATAREGHGAAYVLLGGLMIVGVCLGGIVTLLRHGR